jgi:hypothetical protein
MTTSQQPTAPTDDRAVMALVAAVAGWVLCPFVLHALGWVLAGRALAEIRSSNGALRGEGMAVAARIISAVGIVVYSAAALLLVVLALLGVLLLDEVGAAS